MAGSGDHVKGCLAHLAEAHFAQEIEGILVQQYQLRGERTELRIEVGNAFGKHGIEHRHGMSGLTQG